MHPGRAFQTYTYIDGAYLRDQGKNASIPFPNPRMVVYRILGSLSELGGPMAGAPPLLRRTSFYDAAPSDSSASSELEQYWLFVENQPETDLRFGDVRGKPARQKGVDVLLAVDMLSAALRQLIDVAILISGDADFVPLVNEVRRQGVTVVVAGVTATTSEELRRAADRFVAIDSALSQEPFTPKNMSKN